MTGQLEHLTFESGQVLFDGLALDFPGLVVEGTLGQGCNGIVVRAVESELGREVAVKVWDKLPGVGEIDRALAEAKKLAAIGHPLFVTVHHFGRLGSVPYAVMELVPGRTAEDWRQGDDVAIEDRVGFWFMYDAGLELLHSRGSMHGDPHTKNVIVIDDPGDLYNALRKGYGSSPFGLKLTDLGTSLLWQPRTGLEVREARVVRETGLRIWEPDDPEVTLDLGAHDSVRFVTAALKSYATYRLSLDNLDYELRLQRDDDYCLRRLTQNIASIMAMLPVYHVKRVVHDLGSRVPRQVLENMINHAAAHVGHYQQSRSLAGGDWSVSRGVTERELLESFRRWRETYLELELFRDED